MSLIPSLQVKDMMTKYVRLPYANHWRVDKKAIDCTNCVPGEFDNANSLIMANTMMRQGKYVFGWDVDWEVDSNGYVRVTLLAVE